MSKENFLSEAALKDKAEKRFKLKLKDGSITTDKIADEAVTTDKIAIGAVESDQLQYDAVQSHHIEDGAITSDKIADNSVQTRSIEDEAVTTDKMAEKAITNPKLGDSSVDNRVLKNDCVETKHITDNAVTTEKVVDKSITNDKLADNTLTIDKFDEDLRDIIKNATGMSEDLIQKMQDISENIAELQDSEFPIVLSLTPTYNDKDMNVTLKYSVTSKGNPFVPDTLKLTQLDLQGNNTILSNNPVASGNVATTIRYIMDRYRLEVTKQGRTSKVTTLTRYLCYYGSSKKSIISTTDGLTKVMASSVSFNPTIKTQDGEYIWLITPSYIPIKKVTSGGFEVPMNSYIIVTASNVYGPLFAYRTKNPLTAQTWNLVIS